MTIDDYKKARDLVIEIDTIKGEICDLKEIVANDTSSWLMEVRKNASWSHRMINHYLDFPVVCCYYSTKHSFFDSLKTLNFCGILALCA